MFEKLNNLNLKLQGKVTNIIKLRDESASILFELQTWRRQVMQGNVAIFEKFSSVVEKTEEGDEGLKTSRAGLRPMQPMQLRWAPRHGV